MGLSSDSSPPCRAGIKQVTWDAKFGGVHSQSPCTLSLVHLKLPLKHTLDGGSYPGDEATGSWFWGRCVPSPLTERCCSLSALQGWGEAGMDTLLSQAPMGLFPS